MVKTITIQDEVSYDFKTSAFLPILYRKEFGADFFSDMDKVDDDVMVAFQMAYTMYKHANPEDAEPYEIWLDHMEIMALVESMPEMIAMITDESYQTSRAKKKSAK